MLVINLVVVKMWGSSLVLLVFVLGLFVTEAHMVIMVVFMFMMVNQGYSGDGGDTDG